MPASDTGGTSGRLVVVCADPTGVRPASSMSAKAWAAPPACGSSWSWSCLPGCLSGWTARHPRRARRAGEHCVAARLDAVSTPSPGHVAACTASCGSQPLDRTTARPEHRSALHGPPRPRQGRARHGEGKGGAVRLTRRAQHSPKALGHAGTRGVGLNDARWAPGRARAGRLLAGRCLHAPKAARRTVGRPGRGGGSGHAPVDSGRRSRARCMDV